MTVREFCKYLKEKKKTAKIFSHDVISCMDFPASK
jgi:hypothetical protein